MIDLLAHADSVRAATAVKGAPTSEIGTPSRSDMLIGGVPGWNSFITRGDDLEHVPDLKWKPNGAGSVATYHMMRNDAQIQGIYLGLTLPVRRYNYYIEPNGARPEVVDKIATDYNLPVRGQEDRPRGRSKRRFSFKDHLRHVMLSLIYGHMFFEQVGEIGPDGLWHMRKLGVRMPQTIAEIKTDDNGGLASIKQNVRPRTPGTGIRLDPLPVIPVEKLVAYVWEREGGNWTGRSMFRGVYKNWLMKDTILRVGAINIERAGGVPVVTGPKGATGDDLAELARMARQFRVGDGAGGAIPFGAELKLAGASGGSDAVEYVKLQNEEMSRACLMMFMNLGQATTGSYALGSSLIDYVLNTQETIADYFCDTFNEHVIEDDVDWNWGPDEQAPLLVYKRTDDRQMALSDLATLIDRNLIIVDDELESWIREEYNMPRRDPNADAREPSGSKTPASKAPSDPVMEQAMAELREAHANQIERLAKAVNDAR